MQKNSEKLTAIVRCCFVQTREYVVFQDQIAKKYFVQKFDL